MNVKDNTYGIAPLQYKMLDILKHFISICEKYDLKYWCSDGSCLGALRHHGFIPWDDDLDVIMPRQDYEQLWRLYGEKINSSKYKLCRTTFDKNYHHRVMQLVDLETTFINRRSVNEDIEHGVYIDIIPLDAVPKGKFRKVMQRINAIIYSVYNIQCRPEFNGGKLMGIMGVGTTIMLALVRSKRHRYLLWKKAEKRMTKYNWDSVTEVGVITSTFHELITPFPKEWFGNRKELFENIQISVPSHAEDYCTALYGNFMELPSIEQRKVIHNTVLIDLEKSYTNYKYKQYCINKE